jgi:ElaB/YqjD/DUF883 family membrane-anchored ribosome-binding protein
MATKQNAHAEEESNGWEGPAQEAIAQVKDKMESVDKFLRTAARERPLMTLGVALGIGYLIGRLVGR